MVVQMEGLQEIMETQVAAAVAGAQSRCLLRWKPCQQQLPLVMLVRVVLEAVAVGAQRHHLHCQRLQL